MEVDGILVGMNAWPLLGEAAGVEEGAQSKCPDCLGP